jgi:hypothetical protein
MRLIDYRRFNGISRGSTNMMAASHPRNRIDRIGIDESGKGDYFGPLYRSRFLGHGYRHIEPDLWVASFDDRRSWANGVRRLLGSTPQWASQP